MNPPKRPTPKWVEEGLNGRTPFLDNAPFFNSFRVGRILYRIPRVARSSQPWADLLNAFGVTSRVRPQSS